ncbi:hypothetical protein [Hymenobacter wooponensis]|uniref:Uncharacterized protein n=1 Tax=Hymenobacter wooponensis TaxID=1525360 RepID=A0A4Z0MUE9_9BACT|nr:hypothetical protein [Hymenobacter wooponensis]TGD82887.1 hypothetical protein EU557_03645 [Hymenobacter wooponensis]
MIVTPAGEYQMHFTRLIDPKEAEKMRAEGFIDTVDNQIIRNRIWFSVVVLTAEAFEAIVWCREQLDARRQRKR